MSYFQQHGECLGEIVVREGGDYAICPISVAYPASLHF
jgi:hypothetical protein